MQNNSEDEQSEDEGVVVVPDEWELADLECENGHKH